MRPQLNASVSWTTNRRVRRGLSHGRLGLGSGIDEEPVISAMPDESLDRCAYEIVTADGLVVGTTWFETGDPPMGVASGRLVPTPAYASIRPVVLLAEQAEAPGLRLRARAHTGEYLEPCSHVYITDYSDELGADGLEVAILGLEPYEKFFLHHREAYERQWAGGGTEKRAPAVDPGGPAYRREELSADLPRFPARGAMCHVCGTVIPAFVDLVPEVEARLHQLIRNGQSMMAMHELVAATGCPLRWAKIWVVHDGRPRAKFPGPPCPFCGKPLRTSRAKQCPHCLSDWHQGTPPAS